MEQQHASYHNLDKLEWNFCFRHPPQFAFFFLLLFVFCFLDECKLCDLQMLYKLGIHELGFDEWIPCVCMFLHDERSRVLLFVLPDLFVCSLKFEEQMSVTSCIEQNFLNQNRDENHANSFLNIIFWCSEHQSSMPPFFLGLRCVYADVILLTLLWRSWFPSWWSCMIYCYVFGAIITSFYIMISSRAVDVGAMPLLSQWIQFSE